MQQTHKYFWIPIPFIIMAGLIKGGTLDFQLHNNYLVIGTIHLCGILSTLLFIYGIGYYLLRQRSFSWVLTVSHVGMTLIAFIALVFNLIYFPEENEKAMQALTLFTMFLFGGLLCYLVNILWTLIAGKNSRV